MYNQSFSASIETGCIFIGDFKVICMYRCILLGLTVQSAIRQLHMGDFLAVRDCDIGVRNKLYKHIEFEHVSKEWSHCDNNIQMDVHMMYV